MSTKKERISIDPALDQVVSVSELELASGKRRYSVYARIDGKQHRKRTKTLDEAKSEAWAIFDDFTLTHAKQRRLPTSLTPEQLRDAETAFQILSESEGLFGYTLDEALRRLIELQPATTPLPLEFAKAGFLKSRKDEKLNAKDYADYERTFKRLERVGGGKDIHLYEPSDIKAYLDDLNEGIGKRRKLVHDPDGPSLYTDGTYNKHVGRLATFFTFCREFYPNRIQPKVHPCRTFKKRKVSYEDVCILSPCEAQLLMDFAEGFEGASLVTYFALNLFMPIRPDHDGESGRLGVLLAAEEQIMGSNVLTVPSHSAKGRRKKRKIDFSLPLQRYQIAYPIDRYPLIPPPRHQGGNDDPVKRLKNALARFRYHFNKRFGEKLGHNICRHSCLSYDLALSGSYAATARKAGTSEEVIRANYEGEADREAAIAYWLIAPLRHPDRIPDLADAS